MKKLLALVLAVAMMSTGLMMASAETFIPGTYEATAQGFGGTVSVKLTVDESTVTAIEIVGDDETDGYGKKAIEDFNATLVGISSADDVDVWATATVTSTAVKEAVASALAQAAGEAAANEAELAFTPGTYTASAAGYNGDLTVDVTFSETAVTDIQVVSSVETEYVGDVAFDIMIPQIVQANGTGVDAVGGATFSSRALRNAVNAAARASRLHQPCYLPGQHG